jgi:hypothetical protein
VEKVVQYYSDGKPDTTWTCSQNDCKSCGKSSGGGKGSYCNRYTPAITIENVTAGNPTAVPGCKHGDTVKLEWTNGVGFSVYEIAITEKQDQGNVHALLSKLQII